MPSRSAFVLACALASTLIACAPATRPTASVPLATPSPSMAKKPELSAAPSYERSIDPMARAFDSAQNPFQKRAIARQWSASAAAEESTGHPRIATSQQALQTAETAHPQGCDEPSLEAAISRVEEQKQSLERRYLEMTERMGDEHRECRSIDAQVHALRDELGLLETQAHPCRAKALSPRGKK